MAQAYIVDAVRTPVGRRKGGLAQAHPAALGIPDPFSGSKGWTARYGTQEVSQFRGAEMIAQRWEISRADMEAFALESHRRALRAIDEGRFAREIVPYGAVAVDEGPRRDT